MENNKEIKGWSWLGFIFMPYYYAGYGDLKKGLGMALFLGVLGELTGELMQTNMRTVVLLVSIVVGLSVAIYGGTQAKKELPIKQQKFSWLHVFYAWLAYVFGMLLVVGMFALSVSPTPTCSDPQTKKLVKQIAMGEYEKQGMKNLSFKLSAIRLSAYDKEIDKYKCEADITVYNEVHTELSSSSIIYTSQTTEDKANFYVEVFGL